MAVTTELRLEGAPNFRDLGGCVMSDGRHLKRLRIFRSGELSRLSDADIDTLRELNIAFVVDLRSSKEAEMQRSRWPADRLTDFFRADIAVDIKVDGVNMMDLLKADPTPAGAVRMVDRVCRALPDLCGVALKRIVDKLASGCEPVLFHCTNGRDRTGVVSALLLYILGATRETIIADFLLTNERVPVSTVIESSIIIYRELCGVDLDHATLELIASVRPESIDSIFSGLEAQYGSAERYLDTLGIDENLRQRLRERLLV